MTNPTGSNPASRIKRALARIPSRTPCGRDIGRAARLLATAALAVHLLTPGQQADDRKEYIYIDGRVLAIEESAAASIGADGCAYSVTPTSKNVASGGGSGTVAVATDAGCTRTAVSNASWITVTGGAGAMGDGAVTFSVAANAGPARTGTITVGGRAFTVTQADGCTYALSAGAASVAAGATSGSVGVTCSNGGCARTAASNASWITVTGGAGATGSGAVTFSVAANAGPARTGTITVAGKTFTVAQANGCTYSLSPAASGTIGQSGGSGSFTVNASDGACGWTAGVGTGDWITVTGPRNGTGTGSVGYSTAANTWIPRTGSIVAGGKTYTVNQAGLTCQQACSVQTQSCQAQVEGCVAQCVSYIPNCGYAPGQCMQAIQGCAAQCQSQAAQGCSSLYQQCMAGCQ
ncbi:MAG: hypothetical protein LBT74_07075 [Acidobacteriota bacterium]|jgi:hypothetical protein|nr:hypothetical protein [Acidobacteriota bacterium]